MASELKTLAPFPEAFGPAALDALSSRLADPDWLKASRRNFLEGAMSAPAPTREDETWRRTDPARFRLDRFAPSGGSAGRPAADALLRGLGLPEVRDGVLLSWDGTPVHLEASDRLRASKAEFGDFSTAARNGDKGLRDQFASGDGPVDRWAALSSAFVGGGSCLRVPRGVTLDEPVCIVHHQADPGRALFLKSLIHVGEGATATILEILHGDDEAQGLMHATVDVVAEAGSRVRYLRLQELGAKTVFLSRERLHAHRDSLVEWGWGALGASTAKSDMAAHLLGPGAHTVLSGFYYGTGTRHVDHHTFQDHVSGQTTSDLLYKGVANDKSRNVYMGLIKIHKDAQRSDAYQANRNLILSPGARTDSIPSLEIEANDVRCTHGATMGQLDEEQLFYMLSRGLSRHEATRLIVEGFYEPVFDRLSSEALRQVARARLHARFPE